MADETRDQRYKRYKKELDHIIKVVLDQADDSGIEQAHKEHRCRSVLDIIIAKDSEINSLDFTDTLGNVIKLTTCDLSRVCQFKNFYHWSKQTGRSFNTIGEWERITCEEYNNFRCSKANILHQP